MALDTQSDQSSSDQSSNGATAVAEVKESVEEAVSEAGERFELIGRVGWIGKGVVYLLLGFLFLRIALSDRPEHEGHEANQAGVLETIVGTRFGEWLLSALVVGLLLYALWRLFTVVLPGDWSGRALLDRGGYLVSAIIYSFLCITAVDLLTSEQPADADRREDRVVEDLVKDVLSTAYGRAMVVVAGLAVVVVGLVFAKKGIARSFRSELTRLDGVDRSAIEQLGRIGWIARGVSMGLIGGFLIRAGWLHDSEDAAGLDDSIRQLTGSAWGSALASVVGGGFIAYAVFVLLSARHRILRGPKNDH